MRVFIAIVALMFTTMLASCPLSVPKADTAMLANGKPMQPFPWSDANKTQVEADLGMDLENSPPDAEVEAKFAAAAWWNWSADAETLRLECGVPLLWDSSIHGLYTTQQDISGTKLRFTKKQLIQPGDADAGDKWFTYNWSTLGQLMATDSQYQSDSIFYMVVTPYEKGCYIVCFKDKLVFVSK